MLLGCFFKKLVKTAVLDDGRPSGALVLAKLVEWYRFEVGDGKSFFVIFDVLSSERINGQRAKTYRKTMREGVPPLQNSKGRHQKWAASPPTLRAGSSGFGKVERARA